MLHFVFNSDEAMTRPRPPTDKNIMWKFTRIHFYCKKINNYIEFVIFVSEDSTLGGIVSQFDIREFELWEIYSIISLWSNSLSCSTLVQNPQIVVALSTHTYMYVCGDTDACL